MLIYTTEDLVIVDICLGRESPLKRRRVNTQAHALRFIDYPISYLIIYKTLNIPRDNSGQVCIKKLTLTLF